MRCESMSSTVAQCPVAPVHRCQLTIKTVLHVCQPYVVKTGSTFTYCDSTCCSSTLCRAYPRQSMQCAVTSRNSIAIPSLLVPIKTSFQHLSWLIAQRDELTLPSNSQSVVATCCPVPQNYRCQLTIKTVLQHLSWLIAQRDDHFVSLITVHYRISLRSIAP